jgi:hypothetical protein
MIAELLVWLIELDEMVSKLPAPFHSLCMHVNAISPQ